MTIEDDAKGLLLIGALFICAIGSLLISPPNGLFSTNHSNCIVIKEDSQGPLGGHFFDVSCNNKIMYNVGEWLPEQCGVRINDIVTVSVNWYGLKAITKDDSC